MKKSEIIRMVEAFIPENVQVESIQGVHEVNVPSGHPIAPPGKYGVVRLELMIPFED